MSYRTWGWAALGGGSGLAAVLLVYAGQLGQLDPAAIIELHRRWPAFLLLDTLPILLAWIGWLAGALRATEAALTATRSLLGPLSDPALANTILDPVLMVDADGRIIAANPAATALLEAENLVGTALDEVLPDIGRKDGIASERRTRSRQLVGLLWPTIARRADGTSLAVTVSCGPAPGNRVIYVLGTEGTPRPVDRDVEDRMVRERDAATSELRAKRLFVAWFIGELRGRLDLVESLGSDGDEVLGPAVHSAAALVDDLTDLTRIEAGRLSVLVDVVPLGPVLARVVETGQRLGAARGTTVSARPIGPLTVRGDGQRVEQVLGDLLENACRATKNGRVRLVAEPDDDERFVRIDVADTGTGMSPEQVERLFDAPVGTDPGFRRRFGGASLVLCRRLAEQMGGTLTVTSTFGAGTTATLRLRASVMSTRAPRTEHRPLVIVDRRPEPVRSLLRAELARAGIDPVVWPTVEDVAALDPWAVAVDLDLGDELLSEFVGNPSLAGVPILAATSTGHDRARTLPDGVCALLDAPFDARELVPALIRADRAVRGCRLEGSGGGVEKIRRALNAAGFRTDNPVGVVVRVDAGPAPADVVSVRSEDPQEAVDLVCLATRRSVLLASVVQGTPE